LKRIHATITGRVQGVSFRYFTQRAARELGLSGWVRNGDVELAAEGPEAALQALLDAVRRGPSAAQVDEVRVEWGEASGEWDKFRVRFTA
jgi:acylphosphatase